MQLLTLKLAYYHKEGNLNVEVPHDPSDIKFNDHFKQGMILH